MVRTVDSQKARLGVLISGRGSNMQAIHQAVKTGDLLADISLIVSNRSKASGLDYAREQGLSYEVLPKKREESKKHYDKRLLEMLETANIDLLILAGYNRIVSEVLLNAYEGRILNIHPSLLPQYGGVGMVGDAVHEEVLENNEAISGCTVHGVTADVDGGPVLGQAKVAVLPDDTVETLSERVLKHEHQLYWRVIQSVIDHNFSIEDMTPIKINTLEPKNTTGNTPEYIVSCSS